MRVEVEYIIGKTQIVRVTKLERFLRWAAWVGSDLGLVRVTRL